MTLGRVTCDLCGGSGCLPVLGLDPVRVTSEAYCLCVVQLLWDGHTLWVNDGTGSSIARFGIAGIDIHRPMAEQVEGAHQCLACEPATEADLKARLTGRRHRLWGAFERQLREHHGIEIPAGFAMEG